MRLSILTVAWFLVIFLLVNDGIYAKRTSGRSRGKSSGSGGWWSGRRKQGSSSSQAKPAASDKTPESTAVKSKSSSHVESPVKKETSKVQHSSPNQPQPQGPIGWNVPGHNNNPQTGSGGWKNGYQNQGASPAYSAHHNPSYGAAPPAYNGRPSYGVAPPAYNGHPSYGAPPAYPGHAPQYGGFGQGYHPQGGGYHPPAYSPGYSPGWGGAGYGHSNQGYGGFGGFGGYGGHHGGFGGGYPGFGAYPMKKSSGFFSGSTIRNVLAGMVVWHLASSLFKKPYTVVNYYNQPDAKVPEIQLPANVLTLCDGNITTLCAPETVAVCTTNGTIICAATMNQRTPCQQNSGMMCVNTTVPCADANDPLCQNSDKKDQKEAVINMPCLTNLTLDVNLLDKSSTVPNTNYVYCVTTMAIAGPEYKICKGINGTNDYRSVLNENYEWFLDQGELRRNYTIHNYKHPLEVKGEIHMPVNVLTNCSENSTSLCMPGSLQVCTVYNEIMCMASIASTKTCLEESTCLEITVPCLDESPDSFCQNKTENETAVTFEIPCLANVTINAPFSNFQLAEFNGTLPLQNANSSYMYYFNYCVLTLGLPGLDTDLCLINTKN